MPKEYYYDYGYCQVKVTRPDTVSEAQIERVKDALIRFYLGCLDEGVDITKEGDERYFDVGKD